MRGRCGHCTDLVEAECPITTAYSQLRVTQKSRKQISGIKKAVAKEG